MSTDGLHPLLQDPANPGLQTRQPHCAGRPTLAHIWQEVRLLLPLRPASRPASDEGTEFLQRHSFPNNEAARAHWPVEGLVPGEGQQVNAIGLYVYGYGASALRCVHQEQRAVHLAEGPPHFRHRQEGSGHVGGVGSRRTRRV